MEKEKVLKVIKNVWLIIATALSVIFIAVCIIGGVKTNKEKNQPKGASACVEHEISEIVNIDRQYDVIYNDVSYSITFTNAECSYHYNNFVDFVFGSNYEGQLTDSYITYDNGSSINLDSFSIANNVISWTDSGDGFYTISIRNIVQNDYQPYYFYYVDDENLTVDTPNGFTLVFSGYENYSDVKNYIDLDIQANETNINDSVFETLTSSTVGFIGVLSSGITSMVAVFYSDNALTVIGTLSVIVVSVGLCYFLFRLIIGLIRMRG